MQLFIRLIEELLMLL